MSAPRRNLELKASLADPAAAREVARRVGTQRGGVLRQTDTYFHCPQGRLKLREMDGRAELIAYARPDEDGPRHSAYHLVQIADPAGLKRALAAACGVRAVVVKTRELYLRDNVRIHLDEVESLGAFLEFEAVIQTAAEEQAAPGQLEFLRAAFGIADEQLIDSSYGELVTQHPGP